MRLTVIGAETELNADLTDDDVLEERHRRAPQEEGHEAGRRLVPVLWLMDRGRLHCTR